MARPDDDPFERYIDAAAQALAIPLDPAWTPTVRLNLETTLKLAALVEEWPLPDDAEPAPIYKA